MKPFSPLIQKILIAALPLLSANAHADPAADARYSRLLLEPVLAASVRAVESKYAVNCRTPQPADINWMCNPDSPTCNFIFQVSCPFTSGATGGMGFNVQGFDNGSSSNLEIFRISPLI